MEEEIRHVVEVDEDSAGGAAGGRGVGPGGGAHGRRRYEGARQMVGGNHASVNFIEIIRPAQRKNT
ncbi:MAG: hypothetical protein PHF00_07545 [Elusimicrobia bacterium]|nr:hypothetical protein [Elusimicrobiota bacterium]